MITIMMYLPGAKVGGGVNAYVVLQGLDVRPVAGGPVEILKDITEDADGNAQYHLDSGVYGDGELEFA